MINMEAFVSITAILIGCAAIYASKKAYDKSMKTEKSDEDLIREFVRTAPMDRLKAITTNEPS